MTVTVSRIRRMLSSLPKAKFDETTVVEAIEAVTVELEFLRKSNVPEAIFENAVAAVAAHSLALGWVSCTSFSTLGYSESGKGDLVTSLGDEAEKWRAYVVKRLKAQTNEFESTSE